MVMSAIVNKQINLEIYELDFPKIPKYKTKAIQLMFIADVSLNARFGARTLRSLPTKR